MRILCVSLEFGDPLFSGNGTLTRSLVASCLAEGHSVLVACGKWKETIGPTLPDSFCSDKMNSGSLQVAPVLLDSWYRTDKHCAYEQFAKGAEEIAPRVAEYGPDVVLLVDWTALLILERLTHVSASSVPVVSYIFCLYQCLSNNTEDDIQFYKDVEDRLCDRSRSILCLCPRDARVLEGRYKNRVYCLYPPLRRDVYSSAQAWSPPQSWPQHRRYFACVVRLHPQKNVALFVEVVARLESLLRESDITPLLCGSSVDPTYSSQIKSRLIQIFPESIIKDFLAPAELCDLFQKTLLNFHPALYEAYGMTVAEAAAFEVPSVLHTSDIGVSDFLQPAASQSFSCDFKDIDSITNQVRTLLANPSLLAEVGRNARQKSLSWEERSFGSELTRLLHDATATVHSCPVK
eukprot:GILJ01010090.1.p1 GENE.GILJ01010090.1~~GILJ01010090.1.p1  ORF type:complete len:405 (-),score=41.48 GILJ01010090.1:147-1361(-)